MEVAMKTNTNWNIYDAISVAVDVFNTQGYVKAFDVSDKKPNKQVVLDRLNQITNGLRLVPDYHETVEQILDLKKELLLKKMTGTITSYEQQVLAVLDSDQVNQRYVGIVASLPRVHQNYLKKQQRQKEYAFYQENSRFVGQVGQSIETNVTLINVYNNEMHDFCVYTFTDSQNNVIKWLTQKYLDHNIGSKATLKGRVKSHKITEYYGHETVVKNCVLK